MSHYQHILLATDLSKANSVAVNKAKEFKQLFNAKLSVLMVIPVPSIYSFKTLSYEEIEEQLTNEYTPHFEAFLKREGLDQDNPVIRVGSINEAIYDFVKKDKVDCLVLGSHGERGVRTEVGSTIQKVVQRTACDVFIAHAGN